MARLSVAPPHRSIKSRARRRRSALSSFRCTPHEFGVVQVSSFACGELDQALPLSGKPAEEAGDYDDDRE